MCRLSYKLATLLLLLGACGQLSFSQEQDKPSSSKPKDLTSAGSVGVVLITAEEVAGLRLDLLLQRKITLQARSDLIAAEQKLLQVEIEVWGKDREAVQRRLNQDFGCEYDLDARTCGPKKENKP